MLGSIPLGGLISLAILAPNVLWMFLPPRRVPTGLESSRLVATAENIGRVAVFVLPFFYPIAVRTIVEKSALAAGGLALLIYYAGWARYFANGRDFRLLYRPFLGIPVPMATAPLTCFAAAGMLLHSPWLAIATAFFAAAHLQATVTIARRGRES